MAELDFVYEPDEANRLLPDGTYSASIVKVQKKTSKAGNPMLEVCFEAYRGTEKKLLWEYIVRPASIWKLKQLADAFGATTEFQKQTFELKGYVGRSLDISVVTRDDPEFGKQNRVAEYRPAKKAPREADRDVPFEPSR